MNSTDTAEILEFFDAVYGNTEGKLIVAFGEKPYWKDEKYQHGNWNETAFEYPNEAEQAAREIAREAARCDVYTPVSLMHIGKRAKGAAVARLTPHSDVDNGGYDPEKVKAVGGFAVASGSTGNAHVYVPLTESVPADDYRRLCRALSRYLGAVDAKIADNDLLRPPGTLNHKLAALGGDPTPVRWLIKPNGRVEPATLARVLGEELGTSPSGSADDAAAEPVDLDYYPSLKAALAEISSPPDRSADTHHVVRACYDSGLTLAQTRWAVNTRPDLKERLDDRSDDDVMTCWRKIDDQRRTQAQAADDDADPIPLTQTVSIPPFPVDSLPQAISDMVCAVADFTQTDTAMAGTASLTALAACTGGRAEIEVRAGWQEPLNIYTASLNLPGERKSAVQTTMAKPVYAAERSLAEAVAPAHRDAATRKDIALKNAERLRNAAAKEDNPDEQGKLIDRAVFAAAEADSIKVPPIPRLIADDTTPEAAASLLAEQGGRLAIISAEGGIFDIIAGRYSGNIPNLDIWLKGHSGDPVRIDRKNRPPEYIPRPALTLGLMLQPSVLDAIAANRQFRGRGLLARFLWAYPVSKVGRRSVESPSVPETVEQAYTAAVQGLASALNTRTEVAVLKLTDSAYKAVVAIAEKVEPALADDGELAALKDWGSKFVGTIARIAGILHLAEHGPDGLTQPVTATTVLAAYRLGEYYRACAIRAFTEMGTDQITADANFLLDRIQLLGQDEVSERDMQRAGKSRFKTKADLKPVLSRLVDAGYLLALPKPEPTGGRPASPRYKVHPHRTKGPQGTERQ